LSPKARFALRNLTTSGRHQSSFPQRNAMPVARRKPTRTSAELAQRAAAVCLDMKANDVVILGLRGVSDMTDFFVIASGTSDTHVRSVAERVSEEMKSDGNAAYHIEGLPQGRWVLVDFVDVVVHVFHPVLRSFYQLERLWGDATSVPLAQEGVSA
jgi:ribosome-associated protein